MRVCAAAVRGAVWAAASRSTRGKVRDAMRSKMSLSTSCHVGVRSVSSRLRQMTCSTPWGPPVILHPLSPTDPTGGLCPVSMFSPACLCLALSFLMHLAPNVFSCACAWRTISSHPFFFGEEVLCCGWEHTGFCGMLSWEMESGKCSSVKALPCWIHHRGDTQTPTAKWSRISLWLQAARTDTHTHGYTQPHFGSCWQVLYRG